MLTIAAATIYVGWARNSRGTWQPLLQVATAAAAWQQLTAGLEPEEL